MIVYITTKRRHYVIIGYGNIELRNDYLEFLEGDDWRRWLGAI
jgi:hypothetical protein